MSAHPSTWRALSASPSAAREARRIVAALPQLVDPDLAFTAQLLTSELVANSVRHAGLAPGDSIALAVRSDGERIRVEVEDGGPCFDPLAFLVRHRRSDEGHHGLVLVDALADRWGFRRGERCCVWFEIDLVPGRRPWRGREPLRAHPARR
ncbi:MAG TPA: ATP-binding protein [Gaiellaceae bacterium]|nr:ATP-binding protein [Gaiellaceae bacterium]